MKVCRMWCLCMTLLCWASSGTLAQTSLKSGKKVAAPNKTATTNKAATTPDEATPAPKEGGQSYAILVGVEQYVHPKLAPLKYSVDDVAALSEVLKATGYEVTLLTDDTGKKDKWLSPNKFNFDSTLRRILNKCKSADDKIILAFAGHGLQFEGEKDAYFCPSDAKPFSNETSTLISISKVYKDLDRSFAGVKIVLIDACRNDPDSGRGIEADQIPPPKGVASLYSCSNGERAFESDELKHGVFFYHVLQGLKGKAASENGDITFYGLTGHVCTSVPTSMAKLFPGRKQQPNIKADISGAPPVLVRIGKTDGAVALTPANPPSEPPAVDGEATELFSEDFRSAPNKGLPDGWVQLTGEHQLVARQDLGRAHLRTFTSGWEWNDGVASSGTVRLPPLTIQGDFFIELPALSIEAWGGKRIVVITLKSGKDEKLVFRCFEDETGFVSTLPNSEESKPFSLAGKTPYRLRLERKAGTYHFNCNGRTLLTHEADDQRSFDICELEMSPKVMIGSVKIGPLTEATADKPVAEKPETKKSKKSGGRP